eukprot:g3635.t1
MSCLSSLSPKYFSALINGVVKLNIYQDKHITLADIRQQIFQGSMESSMNVLISSLSKLVQKAARQNWTVSELEENLKNVEMKTEHKACILKYWQSHRNNVHAHIVEKCVYDSKMCGPLAWRVDVRQASKKGKAKGIDDDDNHNGDEESNLQNTPTAIFELRTRKGKENKMETPLTWEMDKLEVENLLAEFNTIEKCIKKKTNNSTN